MSDAFGSVYFGEEFGGGPFIYEEEGDVVAELSASATREALFNRAGTAVLSGTLSTSGSVIHVVPPCPGIGDGSAPDCRPASHVPWDSVSRGDGMPPSAL